jgi:COP9 signalosome complex subunit 1
MLNNRVDLQNRLINTSMDEENDNENYTGSNNFSMMNISANSNAYYNPDFEINNPSIDLDVYVSGFIGLMRINRLLFLAEHCPLLRIDALRLALNYIMETYNTQLYISVHKQITDAFSKL